MFIRFLFTRGMLKLKYTGWSWQTTKSVHSWSCTTCSVTAKRYWEWVFLIFSGSQETTQVSAEQDSWLGFGGCRANWPWRICYWVCRGSNSEQGAHSLFLSLVGSKHSLCTRDTLNIFSAHFKVISNVLSGAPSTPDTVGVKSSIALIDGHYYCGFDISWSFGSSSLQGDRGSLIWCNGCSWLIGID